MSRNITRISSLVLMIAFMLSPFLLVACGGGDSGGGNAAALLAVFDTSFQGHPTTTGGALPPVLRDEALEIGFGGNIDGGLFGGFLIEAGMTSPAVFNGGKELTTGSTVVVPYFAFVDQVAARAALQILDDTMGPTAPNHPGIVGRHATKANTLVFDPNVTPNLSTLFGLPISPGFASTTQYDVFIPANSGITIGGQMVPTFGAQPTVAPPTAANQSIVSTLFRTGPGFLSRVAPKVQEITSAFLEMTGGAPAVNPIPFNDTLIIRFTESVDPATVNSQVNLVVRNIDVPLPDQPLGIIVPATIVPDATLREYRITPNPSFGGGPFQIQVTIEKFDENNPVEDAKNLKGLPQGAAGIPLAIQGSAPTDIGVIAQATFTTIAQPGEPTVASIIEGFDDQVRFDATAPPVPQGGIENVAEWAKIDTTTGLSSSQLRGLEIDGTPIFPALGILNPGMRVQFALNPPGNPNPGNPNCTTALCPYSSPFDDDLINNFIAPNGGGRFQAIYITQGGGTLGQLPQNITDSFELVEWAPLNGVASPVTYNGFQLRAGHTVRNPVVQTSTTGLDSDWNRNYDMKNPQNQFLNPLVHPVNDPVVVDPTFAPNESPILCFGPAPYFTGVVTLNGAFIPYPRLTLPFDYRDKQVSAGSRPNPVFEMIVPEPHITNATTMFVNVVIGTNTSVATPFRRNIGRSSSPISFSKDPVIHHTRFTLAKQLSIATSLFYDTSQSNPTYTGFEISPDIFSRPANTRIKIELAAKNNSTATVTENDWQIYVSENGVTFPSALATISGKRFLKARFTFHADLLTNTVPFLDGFVAGFSF